MCDIIPVVYSSEDDMTTINAPIEGVAKYIKQSGCPGHYAMVKYRIEPFESDYPIIFENRATVPEQGQYTRLTPEEFVATFEKYVDAFKMGIQESANHHYKDEENPQKIGKIKIIMLELHIHESDSSMLSFKIAAGLMMNEYFRRKQHDN